MNRSRPLPRGLVALIPLFLAACVSRPIERAEPPASTSPGEPTAAAPSQDPPAPTQQGVGEQRQEQLVEQALANARQSMELRLFVDAAKEAAFALELDPGNAEARDILLRANDLMGVGGLGTRVQDQILRDRIAQERDRFNITREMELGDAEGALGRSGEAIERYQRALIILRSSVHFQTGSPLHRELECRRFWRDGHRRNFNG